MRVYQLILLYYGGCTVCRQVSQNYSGFDMITGDQTPYVFLIGNVFIVVWWWLTGVASVVVVVEYHWSGMFPSVHDESGFQVIWITSWKLYSSFFKREVYLKKGPASKLRTHFRNKFIFGLWFFMEIGEFFRMWKQYVCWRHSTSPLICDLE